MGFLIGKRSRMRGSRQGGSVSEQKAVPHVYRESFVPAIGVGCGTCYEAGIGLTIATYKLHIPEQKAVPIPERGHDGLTSEERLREILRPVPPDPKDEAIAALTAEVTRLREQVTEQDRDFEFVVENNTKVKIENDRLREQAEALSWTKITPENPPNVGDEVFTKRGEAYTVPREAVSGIWENCADGSWTHFRALTPPASEPMYCANCGLLLLFDGTWHHWDTGRQDCADGKHHALPKTRVTPPASEKEPES